MDIKAMKRSMKEFWIESAKKAGKYLEEQQEKERAKQEYMETLLEESGEHTKGTAICAISNSSMYSVNKTEAIKVVAGMDDWLATPGTWHAIEEIVASSMYSTNKVEAIKAVAESL